MSWRRALQSSLIGLAVGVGIFLIGRPILADLLEEDEQLRQYLTTQTVAVGSETVDDYQQVYYVYEGRKHFVTEGDRNSFDPVANGEYIAYVTSVNGAGQIFLHHIPTDNTITLTHGSTNLNPSMYANTVAWERWVVDRWQVYFFDGIKTSQLTEGDLAVEPQVTAGEILFARKDDSGVWRAERYTLASNTTELVQAGLEGKRTVLRGGQAEEVPAALPSPALDSPSPTSEEISGEEPTLTEEPTPSEEATPDASPTPVPSETPVVMIEDIKEELSVPAVPDLDQGEEENTEDTP